jgi:hypothetical protein
VVLVQGHVVLRVVARVGAPAYLLEDGDLRREADDGDADAVLYEVGYRLVDVARVAGEDRAAYKDDFAGAVGRGVATTG